MFIYDNGECLKLSDYSATYGMYYFYECDYDEDIDDYIPSSRERALTRSEVKRMEGGAELLKELDAQDAMED